jgi:hypothetical protein
VVFSHTNDRVACMMIEPSFGVCLFHSQTSHMVEAVAEGYHACIFCYGQTGTGKTYTMEGLQPRATRLLLDRCKDKVNAPPAPIFCPHSQLLEGPSWAATGSHERVGPKKEDGSRRARVRKARSKGSVERLGRARSCSVVLVLGRARSCSVVLAVYPLGNGHVSFRIGLGLLSSHAPLGAGDLSGPGP